MNEKKKHQRPARETTTAVDDVTVDAELAAIRRLRSELEAMGLVRWNGECRQGQKVYVVVPWEEMNTSARAAYLAMMLGNDEGHA